MFRSVDGCASSSGRRRDADQEKTKKDYTRIEAEGVKETSRLQDEREAAEESTRQSEDAKGLSEFHGSDSSCAAISGLRACRALLRRAAAASGRCTTEARVDGAAAAVGGSASLTCGARAAGGHGAGDGRRVGPDGILSTTGVVLSAG